MLPGFQRSYDPTSAMVKMNSCVLFLFPDWLLDTETKYAFACLGCIALPIVITVLQLIRESFLKQQNIPPLVVDLVASFMFATQMFFAYCVMLLVMLYEGVLFSMILVGFFFGYLLRLRFKRWQSANASKVGDDSESAPLKASAVSPCCDDM